jgi:hypothetical protein
MKNNETNGGCSAVLSTAGLCGCGRAVRYMTPSGDACNKYMRCLTYEEQGEALKQANMRLLNLLALIHRDGGHHTMQVDVAQSLTDAEQVLYKWRGAYDVLVPHNAE